MDVGGINLNFEKMEKRKIFGKLDINEIVFLMGLPGSGKTTFAYEEYGDLNSLIVHMDDHLVDGKYPSVYSVLEDMMYPYKRFVVFDGLFLTNKDIEKALNDAIDFYEPSFRKKNSKEVKLDVTIHYWNENREFCLHNDKGRRDKSSEITIKNAVLEKPDLEYLESRFDANFKVKYHDVIKANTFMKISNKYSRGRNYYESNSWSRGGTYGTWCDEELGIISPEPQPEFTAFDDILMEICPNITFLQYKKLYNECVKIDEFSEHDYYGGTEYMAKYVLDMKKLVNMLIEMGLVSE